jgi:hypothetical protein
VRDNFDPARLDPVLSVGFHGLQAKIEEQARARGLFTQDFGELGTIMNEWDRVFAFLFISHILLQTCTHSKHNCTLILFLIIFLVILTRQALGRDARGPAGHFAPPAAGAAGQAAGGGAAVIESDGAVCHSSLFVCVFSLSLLFFYPHVHMHST